MNALYREVTVCDAYRCQYAYACREKSVRPARVLTRRCMRYMPEHLRAVPSLSDLALDLLARRRRSGGPMSAGAMLVLDRLRPDGPIRQP